MASLLLGTTIGGHVAVHANNISTYALTSLPSHNHDDRYFTESESDGRFQPLENQRLSTSNGPTFDNIYNNGWFRNNNANQGLYNQSTTMHWSSQTNGYWDASSTNAVSAIRFWTGGHLSAIRGYVYSDTSNEIGFLNRDGNWSLKTNLGRHTILYGNLTVGQDAGASSIYMHDSDEGTREIHCNSNRIGFLTQAGAWGSWCDDDGGWNSVGNISGNYLYSNYSVRVGEIWGFGGLYRSSGAMLFGTENAGWSFRSGNSEKVYIATDGNIYMAWAGAYISTLLDAKQNASTAINTGNIGNQSVNYAATSGGLNTTFLGNGSTNISSGYSRVIRNENGDGGNLPYAPVLHLAASDTMWQIAGGHAGSTNLQWRSGYAGTWSTPWWTILHSGNYTSYSPSLTGTGASGTWGINITGNAATATSAGDSTNLGGRSSSRYLYYRGASSSGDFQSFQSSESIIRFDQVNDYNGLSNPPGGYTYGGVLSMRGDNFGFQLWGSHTGNFYFKTQWNNDQYSGWREVIHSANIGSYALTSLPSHNHDDRYLVKGGGWYGSGLPGSRWGGFSVSGGEIVFGDGLPNAGQMGILIDGAYLAGENNGFWSLASDNSWSSRRGMYWDGSNLNFTTNSPIALFSDVRAPIFYDSADTYYYVDPNSTSRLNSVGSFSLKNNYTVDVDHQYGIYFDNGLPSSYGIFREGGAWTWPYPDLRIAFHTGIKLGANAGYNGIRFYTDYDMATQVMSVNNGSDPLGGGNVYVNNSLQAGSSLRAPIFYDSENTGYYGDFASTSVMNAIRLGTSTNNGTISGGGDWGIRFANDNGWIQFGPANNSWTHIYSDKNFYMNTHLWVSGGYKVTAWDYNNGGGALYATVFYDANDTGYYVDPNDISHLHISRTALRAHRSMSGYGVGNWVSDFSQTPISSMTFGQDKYDGGPSGTWWFQVNMRHNNGNNLWGTQLAYGWEDNANRILQRNVTGGNWSGWVEYLNSGNFTSWAQEKENQRLSTSSDVTHNSTTSPTFLVNSHSDNTKGYRIWNTSNSSVSAMFVNSSNQLVIAAGAVDQINLNKKVYVNGVALGVNVAPSATAGRIDASNDIVAYSSSDERLKENIAPIENALDKVKSLTGVEFDWKPEYKHAHGYEGHDTGIIAQQVEAVMPSAVRTNDTGFLAVRYEKLIGLLIEGMKEQQAQIDELKAKLDGLTK